jgi:hypothetical protein
MTPATINSMIGSVISADRPGINTWLKRRHSTNIQPKPAAIVSLNPERAISQVKVP